VLSASNTVATLNAAITEIARSVLARSSADATKFYAEMLVTGTVGSGTTTGVGLVSALYNDNAPSATPYHGIWLFGNDQILTAPGTSAATGPSFVSGDTIGIAYDAVAGFMWFNKNGGAWFGNAAGADPTAGASGHGFGMVAGWPILVAAASSSATIFTLRDTAAAQHYTMPTGYVAWSSAAGPPPASSLLRPPPLWVPSDVGDGDLALLQARARFLATPPVIVSGARPWFMVLT
jgi:hypothetical protein